MALRRMKKFGWARELLLYKIHTVILDPAGFLVAMVQSTPSPLWGGIKGGGWEPQYRGSQHPLPTSPIKGEVPSGG